MLRLVKVKKNERSWAINLITDINMYISSKTLAIKHAGGETGISDGGGTIFPDLLLYGDTEQTQILQGWELKLPDVLITDQTLIADGERKARLLNLNSYVLWNFTAGCLYVRNDKDVFILTKSWADKTNHICSRSDVETYKDVWLDVIKEIIIEINDFIISGKITPSKIDIIISQTLMSSLLLESKNIVADNLKKEAIKNTVMQSWLNVWWKEVQAEYIADEKTMYSAYAKVLLLNWINRIVFAHLIKKYHVPARKVESITATTTINDAVEIFNKITSACDFYNIFAPIKYINLLPNSAWKQMIELNKFLSSNALDGISQESFQSILENTVQTLKREIRGQYTTPTVLADILARITVRDWTADCLEPCCGTGTIAKAILKNKITYLPKEKAYRTTWASDKYTFPLQIANISLVDSDTMNTPCQLFNKNAFELKPELEVQITNPIDGLIIKLKLPHFNSIVSNLPFIAFESTDPIEKAYKINVIKDIEKLTGVTLSQKSDIYVFIIFSLWDSLSKDGRMGIILSNSWLATDWGIQFREALMNYFTIEDIIISGNGKWFNNAQVVTTILVLKQKQISKPLDDTIVRFSVVKENIASFKDNEVKVTALVDSINLQKVLDKNIINISSYSISDINKLDYLHISWNSLFYNVSWLLQVQQKLCPIESIFNINRGSKRGQNDLFYPKGNHSIDGKYLIKGIKGPQKLKFLIETPNDNIFCCPDSIDILKANSSSGTLAWINKFAGLSNSKGISLPVKLDKDRNKTYEKHWYELNPVYTVADFVSAVGPNERLFVAKVPQKTFIDQRLIGLIAKPGYKDTELLHALINSILSMFYIEAIGFGRGQGVLDISSKRFSRMWVLNPKLISTQDIVNIKKMFEPLLKRPVLTTQEELKQSDRKEFDLAVLKAYGIEKHYEAIKESLMNMQKSRLSVSK